MIATKNEYSCRVCGMQYKMPSWEDGFPTYDVCVCCGCEAGIHDEKLEDIRVFRAQWLAAGGQWRDKYVECPPNWDREAQMKNIPPEFL